MGLLLTVLDFGADAALLEPEDLRLEIREELQRALACHGCISFSIPSDVFKKVFAD
jgi:hypothetical protein